MKRILFTLALLLCSKGFPLESVFLGAQFGQVLLTNGASSFTNALGYGLDLGFRTNPVLDVTLRSQMSSHSGGASGLTLWSNTLSADYLVGTFYDIEVFLGGGPGVYQFAASPTTVLFGLHAEAYGDLIVSDSFKVGLGGRFHGILNNSANTGSYWTILMRAGFTFGQSH